MNPGAFSVAGELWGESLAIHSKGCFHTIIQVFIPLVLLPYDENKTIKIVHYNCIKNRHLQSFITLIGGVFCMDMISEQRNNLFNPFPRHEKVMDGGFTGLD
jgi:hypothetical protein